MRYLQNPIQFAMTCRRTGNSSLSGWAIYRWLQDAGHVERWVSTDGGQVSGVIRADRFAVILPKLQRLARGPVEFWTVGR